jgi:hypothetical protein
VSSDPAAKESAVNAQARNRVMVIGLRKSYHRWMSGARR